MGRAAPPDLGLEAAVRGQADTRAVRSATARARVEKAARGGHRVPGDRPPLLPFQENPKPQRLYTWIGNADSQGANYRDTEIEYVPAVGAFPNGAILYGCEDMSGKVLEWIRRLLDSYPYPDAPTPIAKRENPAADGRRVLRGAAFDLSARFVRCA
jgi:formylglycine-generating enzyme required for sulfatase activity